ncbi:protein kinase domain-containing protein [Iningainema tapete]|uniref:non-specific serine/threonine protein kinase n=1 Tax=Iningainema tapete BLCC-T55 TaxID=2748662 RepID=A0A8J6XQY7_9CYAN|nr:protein kinase [Iningainema tapete BLCC-T55]
MSQVKPRAIHCINPDCKRPYPQLEGNKFCSSCGAPLLLLERYVPLQLLGEGGFAKIYTVWDQKTQTEKVLKVLVEGSAKAQELFAQEAVVLRNLHHPGVPKIDADGYFHIETLPATSLPGGNPQLRKLSCLVMEKIYGQTLEFVFEQYPQGCPQELVLKWCVQAVEILQELHKRKILHRDIKPSNLMLRTPQPPLARGASQPHIVKGGTQGDQLVLIDFGGAKQFSTQSSSTRLYSSGYSPPEQITGGNVGPSTDFYALGRTMIEMLTGKSILDLEDPLTGNLVWRKTVNVQPELAALLDEMVQEDMRSRPANAAIIKKRLAKISRPSTLQDWLELAKKFLFKLEVTFSQGLANFTAAIGKSILFVFKAIFQVTLACLDTIWTMVLTSIGACVGTITGFIVATQTNLDEQVAEFLSNQLHSLPNAQITSGSEILLFAGAGLGTAWGLVAAGGFGQRRRFLVASLMGTFGYGFGWLVLQLTTPQNSGDRLMGLILAAVSLLTLGLGLKSHHIVHAVIAAFGTALIFAALVTFGFLTNIFDWLNPTNWTQLLRTVVFFSSVGVFASFWLGVSYYLIVPSLRFLGWR